MLRVNKLLLTRIFYRSLFSLTLVLITLNFTGRIGDAAGYLGQVDFQFITRGRTELTRMIFGILPQFTNIITPFTILILISSSSLFAIVNKYIHLRNNIYWYSVLYLPCLLIYASVASKEYLFFIAGVIYVNIEIEDLIRSKRKRNFHLMKVFLKIILLIFLVQIRGPFSIPYVIFALTINLYKHVNLPTIKINNVKIPILIFYSFLISIVIITIIVLRNPQSLIDFTIYIDDNFAKGASFTRTFNIEQVKNIYNPLTFIRIQYSSFFPTIDQLIRKPYVFLIFFESLVLLFLYFRLWSKLFLLVRNDNLAKNIFVITFINITCSYLLIYGLFGYINIGTSQRYRTNIIPISLFTPLIAEQIILNNKLKVNSPHK